MAFGPEFIQHGGMGQVERRSYPQDVTDKEWAFVLAYLLLSREDSQSRKHGLRELFNGVWYDVRTGNQWRHMAAKERTSTLSAATATYGDDVLERGRELHSQKSEPAPVVRCQQNPFAQIVPSRP